VGIEGVEVSLVVWLVGRLPDVGGGFRVEEQNVVDWAVPPCAAVGAGSLPDDLVARLRWPENRVHENLQVVTGSRVAVKIDRSGRLQDPMQFEQPGSHHREIRQHVALAEERSEGLESLGDLARLFDD
jgi:hypothetical protein